MILGSKPNARFGVECLVLCFDRLFLRVALNIACLERIKPVEPLAIMILSLSGAGRGN